MKKIKAFLREPIGRKAYILSSFIFLVLIVLVIFKILGFPRGFIELEASLPILDGSVSYFILKVIDWVVTLVLSSKRIRDIGKSQWFIVLSVIPVISFVFMVYLAFKKGKNQIKKSITTDVVDGEVDSTLKKNKE